MPGDPKECRKHAMQCQRLADEAHSVKSRETFLDLHAETISTESLIQDLHVRGWVQAGVKAPFSQPRNEAITETKTDQGKTRQDNQKPTVRFVRALLSTPCRARSEHGVGRLAI